MFSSFYIERAVIRHLRSCARGSLYCSLSGRRVRLNPYTDIVLECWGMSTVLAFRGKMQERVLVLRAQISNVLQGKLY